MKSSSKSSENKASTFNCIPGLTGCHLSYVLLASQADVSVKSSSKSSKNKASTFHCIPGLTDCHLSIVLLASQADVSVKSSSKSSKNKASNKPDKTRPRELEPEVCISKIL